MTVRVIAGDCRDVLRTLEPESVNCVVTSPPYYGLRDYGVDGQIGIEQTPEAYVAELVAVFAECRRVLRKDGVAWLNLGDSYATHRNDHDWLGSGASARKGKFVPTGYKPKDLLGIPWRVAFALQADGWYLRSEVIWCLSGGAWVYARTQKGDMPVMVKDLVRLDPATVRLWNGEKWTRVLGWGRSTDQSERIELVLRSGERIGCTGGHLWPTQRGNVAARDLVAGDVIRTCTLPEPCEPTRPPYMADDLLWVLGLYLAEGSRSDDCLQLSLHTDEIHWLEKIRSAAWQAGGTMTFSSSGNQLAVRLHGRVLNAVVRDFIGGDVALDKHLTAKTWRLPNCALEQIARGYLDGDGHDAGCRVRLGFCRNYALERDLRTLAARLGATITLSSSVAQYQNGTRPAFRGEWRWSRSGHHNERDRGEVRQIRASRARQFWDIAVEDEPHLFALASGVLTHNCKPNPMPESVTDRPTKAHETVFLLSRSERYWYDADAIAEAALQPVGDLETASGRFSQHKQKTIGQNQSVTSTLGANQGEATRNARTVWTIATQPYAGAHFATMAPGLAERCIKAGCPEHVCAACGSPWVPKYSRRAEQPTVGASGLDRYGNGSAGVHRKISGQYQKWLSANPKMLLDVHPSCGCDTEPMRGTVLDPFGGAGTTALVADRLGRHAVLIELNPEYAAMARRRVAGDSPLFAEVVA